MLLLGRGYICTIQLRMCVFMLIIMIMIMIMMIIEAIRFTKKSTSMLGELRYQLPSFPLWSSSTYRCFRLLIFFFGDLLNGSLSLISP